MLSGHAENFFSESKEVPIAGHTPDVMKQSGLSARRDAQARADMYAFLAAVYLRPPAPDLVRHLVAENFLEELSSLFGEEIVSDLKKFAAGTHPDSDFAALDQEYTSKALRAFQIFVEDFPTHQRREDVDIKLLELREKLAQKEFLNADLYRKMYRLRSSLIYYNIVLERYYDTTWADDALVGKALVFMELEEWESARESLLIFKDKFPNSDFEYTIERSLRKVESKLED